MRLRSKSSILRRHQRNSRRSSDIWWANALIFRRLEAQLTANEQRATKQTYVNQMSSWCCTTVRIYASAARFSSSSSVATSAVRGLREYQSIDLLFPHRFPTVYEFSDYVPRSTNPHSSNRAIVKGNLTKPTWSMYVITCGDVESRP